MTDCLSAWNSTAKLKLKPEQTAKHLRLESTRKVTHFWAVWWQLGDEWARRVQQNKWTSGKFVGFVPGGGSPSLKKGPGFWVFYVVVVTLHVHTTYAIHERPWLSSSSARIAKAQWAAHPFTAALFFFRSFNGFIWP